MTHIGKANLVGTALFLLWCSMPSYAQSLCQGSCDDGNPCTDDLCDPNVGCVHANNSGTCSDANSCTTNDVCDAGACVGGDRAAGCSSCAATASLPAQGGVFLGTTTGASDSAGTCGASTGSPERMYKWVPTTSGVATISTCGVNTQYDTVLYVRGDSCTGPELTCNDDTVGCQNADSTYRGSKVSPTVVAGQTYYIVVDGYAGRSGAYALTVQPPSVCGNGVREGSEQCDGADLGLCGTGSCTAQCSCTVPPLGLPDMTPIITDWRIERNASPAPGDVVEGCAESTSNVDLLRFGVQVNNIGTGDLFLGDPQCPDCLTHPLQICGNPNYICSPAAGHNHGHYSNYARYELLDAGGQAVVVGHKQGFCLTDSVCAHPQYSCTFQGISASCGDVYGSNLGCQYLDITNVPPANYILRVTVDPFNRFTETNETNNVVSLPVTIPPVVQNPTGVCSNPITIPAAGGVVTGATSGTSAQAGTCGVTGASPEQVFQWTPTVSGPATLQTCSATGTSFDTVLYMRTGACATGAELTCGDDFPGCATASGAYHGSRLTPTVTAGQTYYVFVDGYNGAHGNFTLTVTPPAGASSDACANPTVIPAIGGVFTGATAGVSSQSGSCGASAGSPDRAYQWTPTRSGVATIQTCGAAATSYDTVAYLRSGSCSTGAEVACNDDTAGCATASSGYHGSRLTPTVTAGQTYFILVDGYNGASGNYSLTVTPPP